MKLAEAIYAQLSADPVIAAIVGTRIFPNRAKQGTESPHVVFFVISSTPDQTHNETSGLDNSSVQFSCFAADYATARDLRQAVRAALENQTLTGGIKVLIDLERDQFEEVVNFHHLMVDASFWHDPAAV